MLLHDAIGCHLQDLRNSGRSHHTVRNAKCTLTELLRFLDSSGITNPRGLTLKALLRFRAVLATRKVACDTTLAPGSRKEHIGKVRVFCRWLFEQGLVDTDFARQIPSFKRTRRLPKAILNAQEVVRILMQPDLGTPAGCRDRAVLELLYSTGIRREETANLALADVDARGGYLTVRKGKNGKDRVVPIGQTACELLQLYLTDVRPNWPGGRGTQRLLLTRFGQPMGPPGVWSVVRRAARAAGIRKPVSTHTFRHTCATHMVRAGIPIRHLQELLGHESLETTQIYTQLAISDLKAAHRRFHPRDRSPAFKDLRVPPR